MAALEQQVLMLTKELKSQKVRSGPREAQVPVDPSSSWSLSNKLDGMQ